MDLKPTHPSKKEPLTFLICFLDLVAAVEDFIKIDNENPQPFLWPIKVDQILEKIRHGKAVIETLHLLILNCQAPPGPGTMRRLTSST